MFSANVKIKSLSPLGFGKPHQTPRNDNESHEQYEERTWREKAHFDEQENCFIPGTMFKKAFEGAADFNQAKVSGNTKYKKFLESSVFIDTFKVDLGIKKGQVKKDHLFVPSDGRKNGTTRVWKSFPRIDEWEGELKINVFSDVITQEIFEQTLEMSGKIIGIGRWRPRNGGSYGQYEIMDIKYE